MEKSQQDIREEQAVLLANEQCEKLKKAQQQLHEMVLENKALKKKVRRLKREGKMQEIIVPVDKINNLKTCLSELIGEDGSAVPITFFCSVLKTINFWSLKNGKKVFFKIGGGVGKTGS